MNYSKLRQLQSRTKLGDVKFAESIGMTDTGYTKMLEKQTCTVDRLEKICEKYNLPITYFFDDKTPNISEPALSYGECRECLKKEAVIETLKEQLEKKESEIANLNRELGRAEPAKRAKAG